MTRKCVKRNHTSHVLLVLLEKTYKRASGCTSAFSFLVLFADSSATISPNSTEAMLVSEGRTTQANPTGLGYEELGLGLELSPVELKLGLGTIMHEVKS